jgi:hypothetical protein
MVYLDQPLTPPEAHTELRHCRRCHQMFSGPNKKNRLCKNCAERKCLRCLRVFLSLHVGNRLCKPCAGFAATNSATFG